MTILDLTIVCDEVLTMDAVKDGQGYPVMKMMLDDVQIEPLLAQLAKKIDIETVLDYFTDDAIKGYLEQRP